MVPAAIGLGVMIVQRYGRMCESSRHCLCGVTTIVGLEGCRRGETGKRRHLTRAWAQALVGSNPTAGTHRNRVVSRVFSCNRPHP